MATSTVTLAKLVEVFKWTPDSLEYKLVKAACAKKPTDKDTQIIVSLTKLDTYLGAPKDGAYVASETLLKLEKKLEQLPAPKVGPVHALKVTKATPKWQADADKNGDKYVEASELSAYYAETVTPDPKSPKTKGVYVAPPSEAQGHLRVTDQRLAILRHQIAQCVTGSDYLQMRDLGKPAPAAAVARKFANGEENVRPYFSSVYDDYLRQPRMVAWKLSQADLNTRLDIGERKWRENFHDDEILDAADKTNGTTRSVREKWYPGVYSPVQERDPKTGALLWNKDGTPNMLTADMGHQQPYNDYSNWESAYQTFNMINMAGQWPALNQSVWRLKEDAINSAVGQMNYTAGKDKDFAEAYTYVATLFVAPDGVPQTEEGRFDTSGQLIPGSKIMWYGPGKDRKPGDKGYGEDRFAIPTHCLKAVLITLPDGKMTGMAWNIPNRPDLPRNQENDPANPGKGSVHQLITDGTISIDEFEKLTGMDVALPDGKKLNAVEASRTGANALIPYLRGDIKQTDRSAITLLFPAGTALPEKLDPKKAPDAAGQKPKAAPSAPVVPLVVPGKASEDTPPVVAEKKADAA